MDKPSICVLGDVFCGGDLTGSVVSTIEPALKKWLDAHDLRIANLEGVFSDGLDTTSKQTCILFAPPDRASILKQLGVDVVTLANNHFHDQGFDGMSRTLGLLDDHGIGHVGAGFNLAEARRPWIGSCGGVRLGVLGYCAYEPGHLTDLQFATDNQPGVLRLDSDLWREDISELSGRVDRILVLVHWGKEHTWLPISRCVRIAREMIGHGAHAVMGSHPHRPQGFFMVDGCPAAMSLGNFLFPNFLMVPPSSVSHPTFPRAHAVHCTRKYYSPSVPTYKMWSWKSRISLGASMTVSDRGFDVDYRLVHQHDNEAVLCFPPRFLERFGLCLLRFLGRCYELPGYGRFENICRISEFVTALPTRMFISFRVRGVASTLRRVFGRVSTGCV